MNLPLVSNSQLGIISYPRSGSHLITSIVSTMYFYTLGYFSYCEFYTCCKQVPCKLNSVLCKNHDFELNLDQNKYQKILVLYRKDPIASIDAYIRYELELNDSATDEQAYSKKNILDKFNYYNKFVEKWIFNENENILKIPYEDILSNTFETVEKLRIFTLEKLTPQMQSYQKRIYDNSLTNIILSTFDISQKNHIKKHEIIQNVINNKSSEFFKCFI